jgi:Tfp pilus assembly protein PilF
MHAVAGLALALSPLVADGAGNPGDPEAGWSRVRSPHFEVLTDAGAPLAHRAADRLEALRGTLLALLPPRSTGERRIVAIVLASRSRFEQLVPGRHRQARAVSGFYQGGDEWDAIVARLALEGQGPLATLDHEYAHLVLNRSLPAQPLWVAEGLAELLSDAALEPPMARLGARLDQREAQARLDPAPLASLLGVRHDSPEYLGAEDASSLYGRSWALVRWLVSRHGLAGLRAFLEDVAAGRDAMAAFEGRFAPLEEAQATLFDVPAEPLLASPLAAPVVGSTFEADFPPRAEIGLRLGTLLLRGGEAARARPHLERAIALAPDHAPARVGLAELHLGRGDRSQARRELDLALRLSPDDPAALLRDARLRVAEARAEGVPLAPAEEDRLVSQLERTLGLAPDLYEAALLLAELRPRPYARRLAALAPVFEQDPARTEVALAMAALHVKLRQLAAARGVLARARDTARDPAYRFLCEHQMAQIAEYEATTVEVRGRLVDLRCRPEGSLRFTVDAPTGLLWLEASSPRSFLLYGEEGTSDDGSELICGPQDRPVVARYLPSGSEERGVQGSLLWLSFPGSLEAGAARRGTADRPRTKRGGGSR